MWFSGPLPTDKDGYVFIDRNGPQFEAILIWLRSGITTCKDPSEVKLLRAEAKFYKVSLLLFEYRTK